MNGIISREDILKEKTKNIEEGKLVLTLFSLAEEMGICDELTLENNLSFPAMDYAVSKTGGNIKPEWVYNAVCNVYYVIELYLKNKECTLTYEEFINLIKNNKALEVIEMAHANYNLHINRLKKIIAKSKRKIPRGNEYFKETKNLLMELDKDLSICERFPSTSAKLSDFYFGRDYWQCVPTTISNTTGLIAFEETIYSLYNELSILTVFEEKNINKILKQYLDNLGMYMPFNLFEKVVNNYLFAQIYSDDPETLMIPKAYADLIVMEIKYGTINASELINTLIEKFEFSGHNAEYLGKYGNHIQKRVEALKDASYFGELFIVTPPD